jgi:ribosomal-protein-alanine N-acetyltransferase
MDALTEILVRPMTEQDLDAVAAIEQASYTTPWSREHFRDEISAPYSWPFVAVDENSVIGYLCLMCLFEEAQILNVAVSPTLRGRGIARLLLERAFIVAREKVAEKLSLEVRASNSAAISLYERIGFKQTGIRNLYYDHIEDAVLMEKSLKEIP